MATPRIEQETVIVFNAAESDATIYTFHKPFIKKLQGLCKKHPDSFKLISKDFEGSYTFTAPKQYIKVNSPRTSPKNKQV